MAGLPSSTCPWTRHSRIIHKTIITPPSPLHYRSRPRSLPTERGTSVIACVPSAASDQTSTQASTLHCAPLNRDRDSYWYYGCQRAGQAHCQLSPLPLLAPVRATTLCREAAHVGRFLRTRHSSGFGPPCGCLENVAHHHYLRPVFGATCQLASVGLEFADAAVVAVAWLPAVAAEAAEDEPAVAQDWNAVLEFADAAVVAVAWLAAPTAFAASAA
jgi:hypothetical protein